MKNRKHIYAIVLLTITILLFYGCQKKETPNPSGNANVKSAIFSVSTWDKSSPYYITNLTVPEITSSNIDSVAVMVYCDAGKGSWMALPYTQYGSNNYYMNFSTNVNNVQVTWVCNSCILSSDNPNEYYGMTVRFKVVVIPPGARMDVDLTDYEAVKKEFNLKD